MTEQIEVLGQFDVRRDDVANKNETELTGQISIDKARITNCLLYTSPSPRDRQKSRMPSSA